MDDKPAFEKVIIHTVNFIKENLVICFVVLVALHFAAIYGLKFSPNSLWKSEPLKISELHVYPVKSLRGCKIKRALATKNGFKHDRTFMLLQKTESGWKNMAIARYYQMAQFLTSIDEDTSTLTITWTPENKAISFPLEPDTDGLERFEVKLHDSKVQGYKMAPKYCDWFSTCFGYEVAFVFLGEGLRDVRIDGLDPSSPPKNIFGRPTSDGHRITFADCAPYLIVSKTSLEDVSNRLPEGEAFDITKFRPNIVLSGAASAWEEDFWASLRIKDVDIMCKHNCARCASINVDYATGKQGTGESGQMLKKLMKDRRVDAGAKYSPVFGRYSYWGSGDKKAEFVVGDEVMVTGLNKERTVFKWNGAIG